MANKNLRLDLWNNFGKKDISPKENQQIRKEYLSTLIDLIHLQRPSIPQKVLDYIRNRANFHSSIRYNMSGRFAESSDLQMIIRGDSEDKTKGRLEIQTHNCACYFIMQQPYVKEYDHSLDFPYPKNSYAEASFTFSVVEEIFIAPFTTCGKIEAFTERLGDSIQYLFKELGGSVVFVGPYINESGWAIESTRNGILERIDGSERENPFPYNSKSLILYKETRMDEK